jgi:organic radical activating enzyme
MGEPCISVIRLGRFPLSFHESSLQGRGVWLGQPSWFLSQPCGLHSSVEGGCDGSSTYNAVFRVYAGEVDLVDELYSRWLVWILITTVHFKGVDSVLVNTL